MAWLTAALSRAKRMPSLAQLMTKPARQLHGKELLKRREEFRRMANPVNLAAVNQHLAGRSGRKKAE